MIAPVPRRFVLGAAASFALVPRPVASSPETARAWLVQRVAAVPTAARIRIVAPELADNGASVQVTLACDGPMTEADHVRAIHLAAERNPNPGVASFRFTPSCRRAEVTTRIRLAQTQRLIAVAETSDGRAWIAQREVKVTLGGCGIDEPEPVVGAPSPRVRVPSPARPGEIVEVRALVTHAMESGERVDAGGQRQPRRILNAFDCRFDGKEVFAATLEPAIAANPSFAFFVGIDAAGTFAFSWTDDDGSVVRASQAVALA